MGQEDLHAPILETIHQQTGTDTRCHGITLPLIYPRLKVRGMGNSSWVESRIQKTGDRRQNKNIAIRILSSVDFFGTQSIGAELPLWTIKKIRIQNKAAPSVFCLLFSVS